MRTEPGENRTQAKLSSKNSRHQVPFPRTHERRDRPWVTVTVGSEALGDSEVDAEWALGSLTIRITRPVSPTPGQTHIREGRETGTLHACQAEEDGDFPPPLAAGHRRELRLCHV